MLPSKRCFGDECGNEDNKRRWKFDEEGGRNELRMIKDCVDGTTICEYRDGRGSIVCGNIRDGDMVSVSAAFLFQFPLAPMNQTALSYSFSFPLTYYTRALVLPPGFSV